MGGDKLFQNVFEITLIMYQVSWPSHISTQRIHRHVSKLMALSCDLLSEEEYSFFQFEQDFTPIIANCSTHLHQGKVLNQVGGWNIFFANLNRFTQQTEPGIKLLHIHSLWGFPPYRNKQLDIALVLLTSASLRFYPRPSHSSPQPSYSSSFLQPSSSPGPPSSLHHFPNS